MSTEPQNRRVDQVGIVVKDIRRAVEHYESLGFGPFERLKGDFTVTECLMYGRPADFKISVRLAQAGSLQIELIQPISGKSVWQDFLDAKGEGINHLGLFVDNLEREAAELTRRGHQVVYRVKFASGGGAMYFDTTETLGIPYLELVQF